MGKILVLGVVAAVVWVTGHQHTKHTERRLAAIASEIAERPVAVHCQTTAALKHCAEARLAEGGIANAPATGAADGPREHRTRLQQGDDLRERVIHGWTIANKLWTRRCRTSGFFAR